MATTTLTQLVDDLAAGRLEIVALTPTLWPATPVSGLPPMFAPSPGVTIEAISRYDDKGPAWYWNTLRFGEHTGTHFDAPIHWITGRDLPDNACDTIPVRRFIGPACVIDIERETGRNPDFLVTPERIGGGARGAPRLFGGRGRGAAGGRRGRDGPRGGRGCCCGPAGAAVPIPRRSR